LAVATSPCSTTPQFYVSPSGSDGGDGSAAHPWRSVQYAVDHVPAGAVVSLASGTYAPFVVYTPGVTVTSAGGAVVEGNSSVLDVVRINANDVTISNIAVTKCVPRSSPPGGFEHGGSSAIRIHDGTSRVRVSRVTISEGYGTNSEGLPFGCYGIFAHAANAFTVTDNEIFHTGTGIFVRGGGQSAIISDNRIHDNNAIVRNTTANPDDDFGAMGIAFVWVSATPGPVAENNVIYNNSGPSHDYGNDGAAFELYQSSNVTMRLNTIYNNKVAMETGTDPGGVCANNVFSNNDVRGRTAGSTIGPSPGLLLRAAQNMQVVNNTITNMDHWVFDIGGGGTFGSAIDGLTIKDNTITQSQKVYALERDPAGLGLVIDANRFHFTGSTFASLDWSGTNLPSLAGWQSRTGFDRSSGTF
jgi:hypothetical protein